MPELRNPRWERFARAYVECGVGSEALRRAGYRAFNVQTASVDASRLLARASIKDRISVLKAKSLLNAELTRGELERYLSSVIVTPAGHVTPDHPLCQAIEVSDKGTKVKIPDKNVAAQALARLNGWEQAQSVNVTVTNPLATYLRQLRGGEVRVIEDSVPTSGLTHAPNDVSD